MAYKITVERMTIEKKVTKKYHQLHNLTEFDKEKNPQYGYIPVEEEVLRTDTVYEQVIDNDENFDLIAVINAVNNRKEI